MKQYLIVIVIGLIVSLCYNFYFAGKIEISEDIFNFGLQTGRQQVIDNIINQLQTTQELRLRVGQNEQGEDMIIKLKPFQ